MPHGRSVLILLAHPALEKSRVNARLAAAVQDLHGITFHDLYEAYPEFDIDVPREQRLLEAHSTIVLQHPFFWYSTPALVKQWEDLVLEHGWAYGSGGTALAGKRLLSMISTGGGEDAYRHDGPRGETMSDLLSPLRRTFELCGMDYLPPFVVHGTHGMGHADLMQHVQDYRRVIESLRDNAIDLERALTMAATPLLMLINEKLLLPRLGTRERETRPADAVDERNPVIVAGFGSFGSAVGRLLRANGVGTTVLEVDSDRVDLLRTLGLQVFYGDATRHDLLRAAGAEEATLLVLALDDDVKNRELVETARRHFPNLTMLARAGGRQAAYELIDSGVVHVFRDTLESSLQMGVRALRLLGFRAYQAQRAALTFRHHDEMALRELAMMRHDQPRYIDTARRRIEDLETMMRGDLDDQSESRDVGWDTESLRHEFGSGNSAEESDVASAKMSDAQGPLSSS